MKPNKSKGMKLSNLEPTAKKVVDTAKKEKAVIIMCVDGYQTESEALYLRDMLWYARNNGVVVHFVPVEPKKKSTLSNK